MISINGIGWLNKEEYGCIMKRRRVHYKDKTLLRKKIFSIPFKNFGRLDNVSRMTCYTVALALKDAGIEYSLNRKQDIGIIGTNTSGSLQSDIDYFKDYLESGRTLSRGNLFIYTLPSSPLGEAAIHHGLQGPLLYIASPDKSLLSVLSRASEMILLDEAPTMLAGMTEEDCAVYFVLKADCDSGDNVLCDITQAMKIISKDLIFDKMINEFSIFKKGGVIQ